MLFAIPDGYRLLVGRDISDAAAFRDRIKTTLLWSGLVALGIGLVGGTVMSRNMLRRVEQVNRTAERVVAGNLSDRVPRRGTNDEFDQLAANLNGMLDQIERLMTGMREVTDNVAHDLKTPLSRLRARLELALLGPGRSAAQSRGDPRRDRGGRPAARHLQRAAQHRRGGSRRRRPRPASRSISARSPARWSSSTSRWPRRKALRCASTASPATMIRGDRHLLSQAVANLLDNARQIRRRQRYCDHGAAQRRPGR